MPEDRQSQQKEQQDQETDTNQNLSRTRSVLNGPKYQASKKLLTDAEYALRKTGHKFDTLVENKKIKWLDHDIEIETSFNNYEKIPWEPGYIFSYYRDYSPDTYFHFKGVYVFINENSWPKINQTFLDFLDYAKTHYQNYNQEMPPEEVDSLTAQYDLADQTLLNYENHFMNQAERKKIRTMTWEEILNEYKIEDLVYCDSSLDLVTIASWFISDEPQLETLVDQKKVKLLEYENINIFPKNKVFKTYKNFLIYIK